MPTVTEHIRQHLLQAVGLGDPPPPPKFTSEQTLALWESEWVPEFEKLQRNRFVMGALRYGTMEENRRNKTPYNRVDSMIKRLHAYAETGNLEHLVDIANLAMLEFDQSLHPKKHFNAIDSDGRVGTTCS
jgi:hypothetical protein